MDAENTISEHFEMYWDLGLCEEALQRYRQLKKQAFIYAEQVGEYLESQGRVAEAMKEYEMVMNVYKEINILPLPGGPLELYKLGVWYADKDPVKARKYLEWYLKADTDWVCFEGRLTFKGPAMLLLAKLVDLQFNQIIKVNENISQ